MESLLSVKGRAVGKADFASEDQEFSFGCMSLRCLLGLCGDVKSAEILEMNTSCICKSESQQSIDDI